MKVFVASALVGGGQRRPEGNQDLRRAQNAAPVGRNVPPGRAKALKRILPSAGRRRENFRSNLVKSLVFFHMMILTADQRGWRISQHALPVGADNEPLCPHEWTYQELQRLVRSTAPLLGSVRMP